MYRINAECDDLAAVLICLTLPFFLMRTIIALIISGLVAAPACAQFDYGLSAGGVLVQMRAFESNDPHVSTWVNDVGRTAFSASAIYRECYSDFVDLGFDLTLTHQSFNAGYSDGGLGSGSNRSAHVEIDQLYIGVKPEVRMDAKRSAVVRFGLLAGMKVGGSARGSSSSWSVAGPGSRNEDADLIRDFGSDLRFAFGFGFRIPAGGQWAVTVDPEATIGLTSMLHADGTIRGSDIGLRVGLSRRSKGRALTSLFKVPPRDPGAAVEW